MVINPLSYSVEQGQKTLFSFNEEKKDVDVRFEAVKEVDKLIESQSNIEESKENL